MPLRAHRVAPDDEKADAPYRATKRLPSLLSVAKRVAGVAQTSGFTRRGTDTQ